MTDSSLNFQFIMILTFLILKVSFSLHFTKILPITDWYNSLSAQYVNTIIPDWLIQNFSASNYALNQIISVYVNLYQQEPFSYEFSKSLDETCHPVSGGASISCPDCRDVGAKLPMYGCNHHDVHAGFGPCDNGYTHCNFNTPQLTVTASCPGSGGKKLTLYYKWESTDTSVARVIRIRYQNINNQWSLI